MVSTDWKILETEDFWSRGEYKRGLRNTLDVVFADTPDGVVFTLLEELMRSERRFFLTCKAAIQAPEADLVEGLVTLSMNERLKDFIKEGLDDPGDYVLDYALKSFKGITQCLHAARDTLKGNNADEVRSKLTEADSFLSVRQHTMLASSNTPPNQYPVAVDLHNALTNKSAWINKILKRSRSREMVGVGWNSDSLRGESGMLHVDLFPNGSGYCYQNPCNLMVIPDRSFVNAIVSAWQQVGSHKYDMRWRFDTSSPSFLVQIEGGSMGGAFGVMLTHLVQDVPTKKHLVVIAGLDAQGILTPVNEKTLSDKVSAKPDSVKRLIASKDQTCRAGLLTTCPHTSDASHLHLIPVDGCQCFGAASLADASKIATNRMRLIMKRWGAVATGMFLLVLLLVPLILKAVGSRPPNDRFDDGKVGYHWKRVSGVWRVEDGRLKGTSEDNYGGLILTRGHFKDGIFSYEVQGSPSMIWSRRPPYTINKTAVFRYQDQRNHMQLILFTPWPRFGVPRSAEGRMDLVHIVAGKEVYRKTKYYTPVALPEELERRFQVTIRLSGPVTRVFVDENTMSFDYNIDREFTFSVESAFQNDLDSRYISDGLRREFEEKRRISLSENVAVSTQEQGSRWLIVDHEYKRTYIISKEANQLNVSVEPVIGHVGFQLWPYEKGRGGLSCYFDNVVVTPDQ